MPGSSCGERGRPLRVTLPETRCAEVVQLASGVGGGTVLVVNLPPPAGSTPNQPAMPPHTSSTLLSTYSHTYIEVSSGPWPSHRKVACPHSQPFIWNLTFLVFDWKRATEEVQQSGERSPHVLRNLGIGFACQGKMLKNLIRKIEFASRRITTSFLEKSLQVHVYLKISG